ncbi:MAG: inorganic phosphate transporter [Planctomycetes bacterium]|nr:inorganic phosphate transporter [Planctomycetota bacterium]
MIRARPRALTTSRRRTRPRTVRRARREATAADPSQENGQGFTSNLATALLVIGASRFGLPVSTTHVACGSIFGIGVVARKVDPSVLRNILLSWLATLPLAALCAAGAMALVGALAG